MNQKPVVPAECNVIILCHSDKKNGKRESGSGPIEPLLKFFTDNKAHYIFLIEQPHPLPDIPLDCTMEVYKDGQLVATHVSDRFRWLYDIPSDRRVMKTYLRFKLRDVLASRHLLSQLPKLYPDCGPIHFLIGMESLNALVGQSVRKRLSILKVIYYTFDWSHQRYNNRIMSMIFAFLDKWACKRADVAWNISDNVAKARKDILGYDLSRMAKQLTVLYGVEFREGLVKPYDELEKFKVIFSGSHHADNGTQFLPDIARYVQEVNPKVKFIITGGGTMTDELKAKVHAYGLHNIEFTGYISGTENIDRLTCECLIGLAPYPDNGFSTKKYGDVIKIRTYLACGLAVVSTYVPATAKDIQEAGLGIVTGVDAKEMADAILKLCADETLLRKCRDAAIRKAKEHNWTSIYARAVSQSASPKN